MQTAQGNMLQSLRAVHAFLDENAAKLTGVVNTGARQKLDDAIAQLSTHASDQTGHYLAAQGATQKKAALRAALLRDSGSVSAPGIRDDAQIDVRLVEELTEAVSLPHQIERRIAEWNVEHP